MRDELLLMVPFDRDAHAIADAIQTLEVFRLRSFDALLLDAGLGGIGAIELLRRLRARSDRAPATERTDIPILVLAASDREVAIGLLKHLDRLVANFKKCIDEFVLPLDVRIIPVRTAPFQGAVPRIRIEYQIGIAKRDQ